MIGVILTALVRHQPRTEPMWPCRICSLLQARVLMASGSICLASVRRLMASVCGGLAAQAEIPGCLVGPWLADKLGRKRTIWLSFSSAAIRARSRSTSD